MLAAMRVQFAAGQTQIRKEVASQRKKTTLALPAGLGAAGYQRIMDYMHQRAKEDAATCYRRMRDHIGVGRAPQPIASLP